MAKKVVKKTVKKVTKVSKPLKATKPVSTRKTCPECGSRNIIYSRITDRVICQDCAAIFASLVPEDEEKFNAS
ncbi:MAG: hypothetical protein KJ601_07945 [Nanoarchaeota archaeon]|nr:hypothetical protein [Nanoarchaeota archaeon]MBU1703988.1 hypothetical protein [Nanoarchaeota archaeon]